jgi:hypothetical protein
MFWEVLWALILGFVPFRPSAVRGVGALSG